MPQCWVNVSKCFCRIHPPTKWNFYCLYFAPSTSNIFLFLLLNLFQRTTEWIFSPKVNSLFLPPASLLLNSWFSAPGSKHQSAFVQRDHLLQPLFRIQNVKYFVWVLSAQSCHKNLSTCYNQHMWRVHLEHVEILLVSFSSNKIYYNYKYSSNFIFHRQYTNLKSLEIFMHSSTTRLSSSPDSQHQVL